jgi:hypothetical protein
MKKLSNGISNYEELIEDGYYYEATTNSFKEKVAISIKSFAQNKNGIKFLSFGFFEK